MAALSLGTNPGGALASASTTPDQAAAPAPITRATPAATNTALPAVHLTGAQHASAVDRTYDLSSVPDAAGTLVPVVLDAYQVAALAAPESCHLESSLLAAIGQVESDNLDGRTIDDDHVVRPALIGPALDGRGVARVKDTDGGQLDRDARWDRGLGPMKLLPSAWKVAAVDLGGDGKRDPQNVYDSVGAAMVHLCANGADLSSAQELNQSLLRYKPSRTWARLVLAWEHLFAAAGVDAYWGLWNWQVPLSDLPTATLTDTVPVPDTHAANAETLKETRPALAAPAPTPSAAAISPGPHPTATAPGQPSPSAGPTDTPTPSVPSPAPSPTTPSPEPTGHPTNPPAPEPTSPAPTPTPAPEPECPKWPEDADGNPIPPPAPDPSAPADNEPRRDDGDGVWEPGERVPAGCDTPTPPPGLEQVAPAPHPAP